MPRQANQTNQSSNGKWQFTIHTYKVLLRKRGVYVLGSVVHRAIWWKQIGCPILGLQYLTLQLLGEVAQVRGSEGGGVRVQVVRGDVEEHPQEVSPQCSQALLHHIQFS